MKTLKSLKELGQVRFGVNPEAAKNNRNHELGDKELRPYFEMVEDKKDWRNSIDAYCRRSDVDMVRQAIIFFTATEPLFMEPVPPNKEWMRVTAKGYRLGPAGP